MTAQDRKQQTESLLKKWNIPVHNELPPIEEENDIQLRTPQEIAERIMILTYLTCVAKEPSLQQMILDFLKTEGLWEKASAQEKVLFEKTILDDDDITIISWRGESIWLLLWAINKVEKLDLPEEEVMITDIFGHLPPFMKSTEDFIRTASLRFKSEILDQADLIFRINWAIQKAQEEDLNNVTLNPGVAYERYFAINWIIRWRDLWEEDLADTL